MADSNDVAKLMEGVESWNAWRASHPERIWVNLIGADLRQSSNLGPNISTPANFDRANLRGADLAGANLCAVSLRAADLREADLRGGCLCRVDLVGADLSGAELSGADFRQATVASTFGNNDLSQIIGLDTVKHAGPSVISIDTIFASQGKIPFSFLRGAGVPDIFIEFMPSLVASGAFQFCSCFISYSSKDQKFAERLYADLQNKGVRCWFAPHDIHGGKKLHEQIDLAIRMHERVLLILSANSMNSEWVKTEIRKARKREVTEKKTVLFPVSLVPFDAIRDLELFDADTGKDLAIEIREYFIPGFSDWKNHDSYREAFRKLLSDLKREHADAA